MISMYLQVVWKIVDHDQLASEKPADLGLHCFKTEMLQDISACLAKILHVTTAP